MRKVAGVPYADTSTYRIPQSAEDKEILMLADILPTGYEVGVLAGRVRPGDVVAVVGAPGRSACPRSPSLRT